MNKHSSSLGFILLIIVVLSFVFQGAHFLEHALQFGVWLFGPKDVVYMTPWATNLVEWIASFFSSVDVLQARLIGIEFLHLIGNAIFFIGICVYQRFYTSRAVKIVFWFQFAHVIEHILLTVTILTVGVPLGVSTLFGANASIPFMVSYRIIWHFVINLIPSFFIAKALVEQYKKN